MIIITYCCTSEGTDTHSSPVPGTTPVVQVHWYIVVWFLVFCWRVSGENEKIGLIYTKKRHDKTRVHERRATRYSMVQDIQCNTNLNCPRHLIRYFLDDWFSLLNTKSVLKYQWHLLEALSWLGTNASWSCLPKAAAPFNYALITPHHASSLNE
jgi:hypothetical protein